MTTIFEEEIRSQGDILRRRSEVGMQQARDACQALGELTRRYPKASAEVKNGAADARAQAQCS